MALTPQARRTYTRLFGVEPTPHPTDPELYGILQNQIFGEVFATGVLTDVERELLTVTVLATMQTLPQLAAHVRGALSAGATPLQVREAIYQCAPYLASAGVDLPLAEAATVAYEDRAAAGRAIQEPLYGDEVEQVFSALPEPFNRVVPQLLTAGAFGEIETRDGLDVAMRELISLVAIAALGAAAQMRPHVAGAIRAGNGRQKVAAALVQVLPYIGGPYALSGLALVATYDENDSSEAYR